MKLLLVRRNWLCVRVVEVGRGWSWCAEASGSAYSFAAALVSEFLCCSVGRCYCFPNTLTHTLSFCFAPRWCDVDTLSTCRYDCLPCRPSDRFLRLEVQHHHGQQRVSRRRFAWHDLEQDLRTQILCHSVRYVEPKVGEVCADVWVASPVGDFSVRVPVLRIRVRIMPRQLGLQLCCWWAYF
jgi:hypothetical protein